MFPWTLHYRLLLAVLLPSTGLLLLLAALALIQYHNDLETEFLRIGRNSVETSSKILSQAPPKNLDSWLAQQLRHDSLRQLSVLDRDGHIVAEAGTSHLPPPSVRTFSGVDSRPGDIIQRNADDITHWIAALPDGRWLVLTASRQPQTIAFYERIIERALIVVIALLMLTFLVRLQIRRALKPLGQFARALHKLPPGTRPEIPRQARQAWPDFVDQIEQGLTHWQAAFDELRNNSERAEDELRETLDAIERQNIDLHAARREAIASNQLKSEFLANISHEIRTPLSSLIGFARLLEKTPLSLRQRDYSQSLVHASEHLLAILNDLLDLSKIEAGRLVLDETPVNLHELLDDTMAMLSPLIGDKPLRLHGQVSANVPRSVLGDPLRLRQIMTNLINNAIKFTPRGEVHAHLQTETRDAAVWLTLTIRDTGIGIQPRQLDGLFDAFQQADSSTSRRFGGTGLGLTITRQLVQLMGGDIQVRSEPGQGSTFIVRWQARPDPFQTLAQSATPSRQLPDMHHLARLDPPLRILVVDDHPANLKLLRAWLGDLGIEVTAVDNGLEAASAATRQFYDLVFMDIQMPGMNGLEAAQAIRAGESRGQRVPIIALTAHALSSEREFWLRSGIDDYVSKPLQESQLLHILQQWTRFVALQPPVVDWDDARRLAGGKVGLAEELLQALVTDLPHSRSVLTDAMSSGHAERWWQEGHRLLGACRYCGVPALRASLEEAMTARGEVTTELPEAATAEAVILALDALLSWSAEHLDLSAEPCE